MSLSLPKQPTQDAINILRLLKNHHNVIIIGPPATGKTLIMQEVIHWFTREVKKGPGYDPKSPNPFPNEVGDYAEYMPSHEMTNRGAWVITFHQGTKYRDFVSGFMPSVGKDEQTFKHVKGPLFEAADFADQKDTAALVAVDEINRGPAVAIFGDLITGIESDKRKLPNGEIGPYTSSIRVLDLSGNIVNRSLSHHLYILAAMNEADTSVEPLDVAFRRRFMRYQLLPDEIKIRRYLASEGEDPDLPQEPAEAHHVYRAVIQAWSKVNARIELARGREFQLGHGVLMDPSFKEVPSDLPGALDYTSTVWNKIFAHISEVFFGDMKGIASVVSAGAADNPYSLEETFFGDSPVSRLVGPEVATPDNVYGIVFAIARSDE